MVDWAKPWEPKIQAEIHITKAEKREAKKQHIQLFNRLKPTMAPVETATTVVFYTDGSQGQRDPGPMDPTGLPGLTNSAALCRISANLAPILSKCWNLGPCVEVADAEVIGVVKGLQVALKTPYNQPTTFYYFVDSQAAIQRLQGYTYHALQAQRLVRALVRKKHKVQVHWCPSHVGITGNEFADRLAKKGLEKSPEKNHYTSLAFLRRQVKQAVKDAWKTAWVTEEERETQGLKSRGLGTHYRRVAQDLINYSLKPTIPSIPRPNQSAYIQLKTGIGSMGSYLVVIGKVENGLCGRCNVEQTSTHLLLHCNRYAKQRIELKNRLKGIPITMQVLFCTGRGRNALADYLCSTGICTAKRQQGIDRPD